MREVGKRDTEQRLTESCATTMPVAKLKVEAMDVLEVANRVPNMFTSVHDEYSSQKKSTRPESLSRTLYMTMAREGRLLRHNLMRNE